MSTNRGNRPTAESHGESHLPRRWLKTFAERSVLLDAYRAARSCMAEVDDDPDRAVMCGHRAVDMMTPLEFVEWIEMEVRRAGRGHAPRQDHTENRSAGHLAS